MTSTENDKKINVDKNLQITFLSDKSPRLQLSGLQPLSTGDFVQVKPYLFIIQLVHHYLRKLSLAITIMVLV